MRGSETESEAAPVIMIIERRTQRKADLSPAEVMELLRKRAALRRQAAAGSGESNGAD